MKTLVLAMTAVLTWFSTSVAVAQWPQATYGNSRAWEWEGGVRVMDRPGTNLNLPLVTDALTNQVLFNSNDATDLETAPGFDLRFLNCNGYGKTLEFRSFYMDWDVNPVVTSTNGLQSPFFVPLQAQINNQGGGNVQFNSMNYEYDSELFNLEMNVKRTALPGVTLLAGPRFMYLEDNLQVDVNGTFDVGANTFNFTQTTDITTENPMFGFQVGVDGNLPLTRMIYLTSTFKVGAYGNTARSEVDVTFSSIPTGSATRSFRMRRSQGTFVGEVGGRANMELIPGIMSVYAGWEGLWLDNVALGPPQFLSGVNGNFVGVQMTGTPFIHGLVVGGTIRR